MSHVPRRLVGMFSLVSAAALLTSALASATVYDISITTDDAIVNGNCTLREAITASVNLTPVDQCLAGELTGNTIELSSVGPYTYNLGHQVIGNEDVLTIRGIYTLAQRPRIDLGGANRLFELQPLSVVWIQNVRIQNGLAPTANPIGGAIFAVISNLTLKDVELVGNQARVGGGLAYIGNLSSVLNVERTLFEGNDAIGTSAIEGAAGGGFALSGAGSGTANFLDVVLLENSAINTFPGGFAEGGGAVVSVDDGFHIRFDNLEPRGNSVSALGDATGGGLSFYGAGNSTFTISGVSGADNLVSGASIRCCPMHARLEGAAELDFSEAYFQEQECIQMFQGSVARVTSWIMEKRASSPVSAAGPDCADGIGLEVELSGNASLLLGHMTVTGFDGTGVSITNNGTGSARIENSILWGNGDDLATTGTVDFDPAANENLIGDLGGPDPLFVDPAAGNFELQAGSPARDAGNSGFASVGPWDANHGPRIVGLSTDQGAFEFGAIFGWDGEEGHLYDWSAQAPAP